MPNEPRRLRHYSNQELMDLAREKWIEYAEVYGEHSHETAIEKWYALPARTRGYIETTVIGVYRYLWRNGEEERS